MNETDILKRITDGYSRWYTYFLKNIELYDNDIRFGYEENGQWTQAQKQELDELETPILQFNRIPKFINNILGSYLDNPFNIKIRAIDASAAKANQDSIDLRENLIKSIGFKSRSDVVQSQALFSAIAGGFGAFKIDVVENKKNPFLQDIVWKKINDPTMCFWDPMSEDLDKSDGRFCGEVIIMAKSLFEEIYPDAKAAPSGIIIPNSKRSERFYTEETVTVINYWEKQYYKHRVALLSDDTVMDYDDAKKFVDQQVKYKDLTSQQAITIEKDKIVDDYKMKYYRATTNEILEESDWDGMRLPIIFQPGDLVWIQGVERTVSYIRFLKDAQTTYNWARTEHLSRAKSSRYAEVMGEASCIEGNESDWTSELPRRYRRVNRDDSGQYPIVLPPHQIPPSIQAEAEMSLNDINDIAARSAASLGDNGNERSGVALLGRQFANDAGVMGYMQNAKIAIESGYRNILDLMPKIYDSERLMDLVGEGNQNNVVVLNSTPETTVNDGEFDIVVSAGASSRIQKLATFDLLLQLLRISPQSFNLIADKLFANLDIQDSVDMSERMRTLLPLDILLKESKDKDEIAQTQAKLSQQQQMQTLMQQLQIMSAKLDNKLKETAITDGEAKAQKTALDAHVDVMEAETDRMKVEQEGAVEAAKIQAEENRTNLENLKEINKLQ
jgi:hypothetical protein